MCGADDYHRGFAPVLAGKEEMMLTIVHANGGWCILKTDGLETSLVGSPYATHAEAVEAVEIMAYRIAQGWTP